MLLERKSLEIKVKVHVLLKNGPVMAILLLWLLLLLLGLHFFF